MACIVGRCRTREEMVVDRAPEADRLRALIDVIVTSLDDDVDGEGLAARAFLSRFHFDRQVRAGAGETTAGLRRRLLMERAAWQLGQGASITAVADAAGYDSVDGFTRAFRTVHGVNPSEYDLQQRDFRVPATNGIHVAPGDRLEIVARDTMVAALDPITSHLLVAGAATVDELLAVTRQLPEERLDEVVAPDRQVLGHDGPETTVRQMLHELVWAKEVWVAALDGTTAPDRSETTLVELARRHADAAPRFRAIVEGLAESGRLGAVFIDALCEPPQAFVYAAVIAHVIHFTAHRVEFLADVLRRLDVPDVPRTCPIERHTLSLHQHAHPIPDLRGAADVARG